MTDYKFRQSEIKRFIRCRRSWWLQYQDKWHKPSEYPSTADTGTLVHAGVAAYRQGEAQPGPDASIAVEFAHLTKNLPLESPARDDWRKSEHLARRMVDGYIEWVQTEGLEAGRTSVLIEEQMETELPFLVDGNSVTITYKADHVFYDEALGGLVMDDVKTVDRLSQRPPPTDFQLLTYSYLVGLELGDHVVRAQHTMLRRVLRTGSAKPPFYDEYGFPITQEMLDKHESHLHAIIAEMIAVMRRTRQVTAPFLYPNPNKDCSWDCGMEDVCAMVDDGSDYESVLEFNYEKREDD